MIALSPFWVGFSSILMLALTLTLWGGQSAFAENTERRPVVYQLVVRHFGNRNPTNAYAGTLEQNGSGKFSDITPRALREIRSLGVTHIWLTGVLQQATTTDYSFIGEPADDPDIVKGRAGSFFAIRDYFDVSPDYADNPQLRLEEFRALVARIHASGLKVLIDLVPNHLARSYGSTVHPEFDPGQNDDQSRPISLENNFIYAQGSVGSPLRLPSLQTGWRIDGMDGLFPLEDGSKGRVPKATGNRVLSAAPSPTDWYETILLNYGFDFLSGRSLYRSEQLPANSTWTFMDEVIRYWTTDFLVDGFRVDFAHWVPTDFWAWAIKRARERRPGAFFLAEAYENQFGLLQAGFDAVYDDETYDLLKGVQNRTRTLEDLLYRQLSIGNSERSGLLRYLENHDERRLASPIVYNVSPDDSGFGSMEEVRLFGPLHYFQGGGPLLVYNGQTVGERGEGQEGFDGDNGKTSIFDYWQPARLARWVNGGEFGFSRLTPQEIALNQYYKDLLSFANQPELLSDRFYQLDRAGGNTSSPGITAYARYVLGGGRLLLVVSNFTEEERNVQIKIPEDLAIYDARLPLESRITLEFSRRGTDGRQTGGSLSREALITQGVRLNLPARTTVVYSLGGVGG